MDGCPPPASKDEGNPEEKERDEGGRGVVKRS